MNRRERRTAAKSSRTALNTATANTPAALFEVGLGHMQAGRYLDAQVSCQRALAVDANHPDSLHLMGLLSLHVKQYAAAVEWLARAIVQAPKAEYISSLGTTVSYTHLRAH